MAVNYLPRDRSRAAALFASNEKAEPRGECVSSRQREARIKINKRLMGSPGLTNKVGGTAKCSGHGYREPIIFCRPSELTTHQLHGNTQTDRCFSFAWDNKVRSHLAAIRAKHCPFFREMGLGLNLSPSDEGSDRPGSPNTCCPRPFGPSAFDRRLWPLFSARPDMKLILASCRCHRSGGCPALLSDRVAIGTALPGFLIRGGWSAPRAL